MHVDELDVCMCASVTTRACIRIVLVKKKSNDTRNIFVSSFTNTKYESVLVTCTFKTKTRASKQANKLNKWMTLNQMEYGYAVSLSVCSYEPIRAKGKMIAVRLLFSGAQKKRCQTFEAVKSQTLRNIFNK